MHCNPNVLWHFHRIFVLLTVIPRRRQAWQGVKAADKDMVNAIKDITNSRRLEEKAEEKTLKQVESHLLSKRTRATDSITSTEAYVSAPPASNAPLQIDETLLVGRGIHM